MKRTMARTKGPPRIDLTGQRFGLWTALAPTHDATGISAWRCRCDCGARAVVRGGNLRGGQSKGCRPCSAAARRIADEHLAARVCPSCGRTGVIRRDARGKIRHECAACGRCATRHGRDENGQPVALGPRPVLGEGP
jgi:hypothetical protein